MGKNYSSKIPALFDTGRDIYPIIPYRTKVVEGTLGTINNRVVDFDLQFEDNEVMDLVAIESTMYMTLEIPDTEAENEASLTMSASLLEDPDPQAVDILGNPATEDTDGGNEFEDNASLIWHHEFNLEVIENAADVSSNAYKTTDHKYFVFPQPYTVARNVQWELNGNSQDTDRADSCVYLCTLWGRRRKASDAEFKNIIYRQRF